MTDHDPNPVADYRTLEAWSVGPEGADDQDQVVILASVAHLLSDTGAETVPAVVVRLPAAAGVTPEVLRFHADSAEEIGRFMIAAARAARKATP